jgi:hypothetical protein
VEILAIENMLRRIKTAIEVLSTRIYQAEEISTE